MEAQSANADVRESSESLFAARWACPLCGREITLPRFKRHLWTHDAEGRSSDASTAWATFVRESGYFKSREPSVVGSRLNVAASGDPCEPLGRHICGPQMEAVRTVVERYGRVWAKDSDYYAAAEALGIKEPPEC